MSIQNRLEASLWFLQQLLSRWVGHLCHCRWRWLKNGLIRLFIRQYQVDMSSCIRKKPTDYISFNDFFLRRLTATARPLTTLPEAVACPVDGIISQIGNIQQGELLQAKNQYYALETLLGGDQEIPALFQNGHFVTLYLAPKDYHRVHMPLTGTLQQMIYVPGSLFSVSPQNTQNIPSLFTRNERVISIFKTHNGSMAIIQIGALLVASISTVWASPVTSHKNKKIQRWHYYQEPLLLDRGVEMGHFSLGSTVILLFPQQKMCWNEQLKAGDIVQVGQAIGTVLVTHT